MTIPQCNPLANYLAHKPEIDAAVSRVLSGGHYILGNEVEAFEQEFAAWNNTAHCVSCGSGTDALELILRALDIESGDRVITVPNTAVATVAAIERAGAEPVLVDIDPESLTMSAAALNACLAVDKGTIKAVIAVHLFGFPAAINKLSVITRKHGIHLIEDCAQAHGTSINGRHVGTFGIAGAFSFYPTKNLGACGDGGAIITNDNILAGKLKALRQYGWEQRYISSRSGINSRLDELQATILRVKLNRLDEDNSRRIKLAAVYHDGLRELPQVTCPPVHSASVHVYHQFVVQAERRDELRRYLQTNGIATAIHYPLPIHRQAAYSRLAPDSLPISEAANEKILSLPMFPELPVSDVEKVVASIRRFYL